MIADLEEDKYGQLVLIAYSMSRLTRRPLEYARLAVRSLR
jgi:hypothetical protein